MPVSRGVGGNGHPPTAKGRRPADARIRGAARPARARVADQGRQAWPRRRRQHAVGGAARAVQCVRRHGERADVLGGVEAGGGRGAGGGGGLAGILGSRFSEGPKPFSRLRRSEEHTSELQSLMRISYAVFCLKKKTKQNTTLYTTPNNN